jgi:hypothetical protein
MRAVIGWLGGWISKHRLEVAAWPTRALKEWRECCRNAGLLDFMVIRTG